MSAARVVQPPANLSGSLLAALGALGFATLGIWGKLASHVGLNPFAALSWRFLIVAAVLLPFTWRDVTWQARFQMVKVGLLYGLATTCYFSALTRISAGTTSLLNYLAPAVVILIGFALGRKPTTGQLFSVVLAAAGLLLIVGLPSPADHDRTGLLLGALTAVTYALYLLANEHLLRGQPPLAATAYTTLTAGLYFTGYALATHQYQVPSETEHWGIVLGMAFIATLVPVPALFSAIQRLGAASTSLIATLEPLFAVLLAALILGEPLRPSLMIGGVLILVGAVLAQRLGLR
ncbi:hypothetical protein Dxin01_02674 [Deinococcus xinjiangensis]|uniref:EamA domain-containing protein n=1 Tax=Deinococcus xinjiangensis TaxID=457454 RepID=A0ABP9VGW1_9DEIO